MRAARLCTDAPTWAHASLRPVGRSDDHEPVPGALHCLGTLEDSAARRQREEVHLNNVPGVEDHRAFKLRASLNPFCSRAEGQRYDPLKMKNGAAVFEDMPPVQKKVLKDLHSRLFAFACGGLALAAHGHALRAANDRAGGEPVGYLGHLDLALPALLGSGDKDDETVNLCDAVTAPADLGNGNVVLLSYFNRLWLEGPEAAASAAAPPVAASSSETRSFTS